MSCRESRRAQYEKLFDSYEVEFIKLQNINERDTTRQYQTILDIRQLGSGLVFLSGISLPKARIIVWIERIARIDPNTSTNSQNTSTWKWFTQNWNWKKITGNHIHTHVFSLLIKTINYLSGKIWSTSDGTSQ